MFSTGENAAFLLEAGQPVTVRGVAGRGVLGLQSEFVLDGEAVWRGETLLALAELVADVAYGDQVVIGGQTYLAAHDPMPSADGVFARVPLSGPITIIPEPTITLFLTTTTGSQLSTTIGVPLEVI
jgi:hypothetical protein